MYANGDHNEGELRFAGVPSDAEAELEGKIWFKSIEKSELESVKSNFEVLSTKLVAGRPQVHILSETDPGDGFESVAPDLEDVFFARIKNFAVA